MSSKRLFLIDGMSHIYRAYFAIRNLSNTKGLPTNAVYGFTSMLRKLIQDQKPDYVGVAIDLEGPTVRHERYQAYKATRKPMPQDLVQQIPYIRRVCEAFCVPVLGYPGFEADDVIGTLSLKATEQGLQSIIVTSDKDMLQLVSDDVLVLDTMKDNAILDAKKVEEKLGVRPDQVPDLLGLWGDAVRQCSRGAWNRRKRRQGIDSNLRNSREPFEKLGSGQKKGLPGKSSGSCGANPHEPGTGHHPARPADRT